MVASFRTHITTKTLCHAYRPVPINEAISLYLLLLLLVFLILLLLLAHHYRYAPHLFHHFHLLFLAIVVGGLLVLPIFFSLFRSDLRLPLLIPLLAQGIAELILAGSAFGVGMKKLLAPSFTTFVSLLRLWLLRHQTTNSPARPTCTALHTKGPGPDLERSDIDSALPLVAGPSELN